VKMVMGEASGCGCTLVGRCEDISRVVVVVMLVISRSGHAHVDMNGEMGKIIKAV
jgi:hypothetical protein